jgi:hypothetical protein
MTEAEWLAATDPTPMLPCLANAVTMRKCRLFSVACCRHLSQLPWSPGRVGWRPWRDPPVDHSTDVKAVAAILVAERYADSAATGAEREEAEASLSWACYEHQGDKVYDACFQAACHAADTACASSCALYAAQSVLVPWPFNSDDWEGQFQRNATRLEAALRWQAALVRCVFGNPFRPVAFDPGWRTSDAVALAKGIYDDRAFDRLPILADALQDAGCTNDDILAHCRNDGPHARGCWVVDLVLGKA